MNRFDEPIVCPIVVGREPELDRVQRILSVAVEGRAQVVLISGEAGIGKTRLVETAAGILAGQDWHVVQGNFFEPDRTLPYAGLTDLLRNYLSGAGEQQVSRFAQDAPHLSRLAPELTRTVVATPEAELDADQDKRLLFQEFAQFIEALAQTKTAIILEDLHWSDDSSLELLLHAVELRASGPLLLLVTYRSDEVEPGLRHFIAGLDRLRLGNDLSLRGLAFSDVDRMLRSILARSQPVRAEVLEAIHELTDGNPFFVEEVVRSLLSQNAPDVWDIGLAGVTRIPRSVDESVRERTSALDDQALAILQIAAVAGRRFDLPLLFRLCSIDEAGLLRIIKQLTAADLVVEVSEDRFAFRHALTRQAIYGGMLTRERRMLHGQIAACLAEMHGDAAEEYYGDLAYHAYQAGDWSQAYTFSQKAGERSLTLFSPAAGVAHFSRALDAASHLDAPHVGPVYCARGKAYEILGDFNAALADYEAALALAETSGDPRATGEALLAIGMLWAGKDYAVTGAYFERAYALALESRDRLATAQSLNRVANWYVNVEQPAEGVARHEQALAIFHELADEAGIAATEDLLGMANLILGDLVKSYEWYRKSIGLVERLGDRVGLVSSLATLPNHGASYHGDTLIPAVTLASAAEAGARGLNLATEMGWRSGEAYANWGMALCLGPAGRYGESIAYAAMGINIANEIQHTQWLCGGYCARGLLRLDLLDFGAARSDLEQAHILAQEIGSIFWIKLTAAPLALAYVAAGELDRAEALLRPLLSEQPMPTFAQRQIDCAWGELLLALERFTEALAVFEGLEAKAVNFTPERGIARTAKLRGDALAAASRPDDALAAYAEGLVAAELDGRLSYKWRILAAITKVRLAKGDSTEGNRAASQALGIARDLAATLGDRAEASRYLQAVEVLLPTEANRSAKTAGSGLTRREREVAGLVAGGLSNRAIAEALVLSERTVESHVAAALSKLGFSSRAQLAVWASKESDL